MKEVQRNNLLVSDGTHPVLPVAEQLHRHQHWIAYVICLRPRCALVGKVSKILFGASRRYNMIIHRIRNGIVFITKYLHKKNRLKMISSIFLIKFCLRLIMCVQLLLQCLGRGLYIWGKFQGPSGGILYFGGGGCI